MPSSLTHPHTHPSRIHAYSHPFLTGSLLRGAHAGSAVVSPEMVLAGQLVRRRLTGLDEARKEMWDAAVICGQALHKYVEDSALALRTSVYDGFHVIGSN